MSDIAKLLVETTARLMASGEGVDNTTVQTLPKVREFCVAEARRIVTEFYGPPCDDFVRVGGTQAYANTTKGDVCLSCGWPRGEHGGKA